MSSGSPGWSPSAVASRLSASGQSGRPDHVDLSPSRGDRFRSDLLRPRMNVIGAWTDGGCISGGRGRMSETLKSRSSPRGRGSKTQVMTSLQLSPDAVTVLGLAGTALPFAQSIDDEVERWLRPLRLYGDAGGALQSLGVGEGRLDATQVGHPEPSADTPSETLHQVTTAASRIAAQRGAPVQPAMLGDRDHLDQRGKRRQIDPETNASLGA